MSRTKKRIINLFFILAVLAFFLTPLGYESKILLNRLFASGPEIIKAQQRQAIKDYDWKLKDENWDVFNFKRSQGKVVFVSFWASWRLPSVSELSGIRKLYKDYKASVDFYIITDEERAPVEKFMDKNDYSFPVTYLIIGEKAPFDPGKVPSGYIIDKKGNIAAKHTGVTRWNSAKVGALLNELLTDD